MAVPSVNSVNYEGAGTTYPSSLRTKWFNAVPDPKTADASDTAAPTGETRIHALPKYGVSTLLLRMRYPSSFTAFSADAQVCVIGRTDGGDWTKLPNRDKEDGVATKITLTTDVTNDFVVATGFKASDLDTSKHWFDTLGCDEIAVVVVTAADVGVQSGDLCIEGKFL